MLLPTLGPRGEGWVALQLVLMVGTVLTGFLGPGWPGTVRAVGIALAAAGAVFLVAAVRTLGGSLTPLPKPRGRAELVQQGPYRLVRHPIYGAGMLLAVGYALATSVWALGVAAALTVLWILKAAVEERWLEERFAGYSEYRRRTPRRFLPWLL